MNTYLAQVFAEHPLLPEVEQAILEVGDDFGIRFTKKNGPGNDVSFIPRSPECASRMFIGGFPVLQWWVNPETGLHIGRITVGPVIAG